MASMSGGTNRTTRRPVTRSTRWPWSRNRLPLDAWIEAQGRKYAQLATDAADMIARTLAELAQMVRAVEASTPAAGARSARRPAGRPLVRRLLRPGLQPLPTHFLLQLDHSTQGPRIVRPGPFPSRPLRSPTHE